MITPLELIGAMLAMSWAGYKLGRLHEQQWQRNPQNPARVVKEDEA